jgi:type III secretion system HrpE/YscL family protein
MMDDLGEHKKDENRHLVRGFVLKRGGRVISKRMFEAHQNASRILEQARAQAGEILAQAEEEKKEVFRQHEQAGLAAGRRQATEELARLASAQAELRETVSEQAIQLGLEIAEKILGEQVRLDPETVVAVARRAVAQIRWCRRLTVRAHPEDIESLRRGREDLLAVLSGVNDIELVADEQVERGGCYVDSELGRIDATLGSQLAAIERALSEEG